MSASEPWCEDCEAHHDEAHHAMLMAGRAVKEYRIKKQARTARICETARAMYVARPYEEIGECDGYDARQMIRAAAIFEEEIDKFIAGQENDL